MKRGPTIVIAIVTLALAALAYFTMSTGPVAAAPGQAFLPNLAEHSTQIAAIEVLRGNTTVRLERDASGAWTITTTDGYPVQTELARALIVSLGALELSEPMTSKPERHGELGLAWPDPQGRARRVRLLPADASGAPVADVVLGDERASPDTIFVRQFDLPETWTARGRVQLPGDALGWIYRSLMALPDTELISASLRGLTLTRPDGPAPTSGPPPAWPHAVAEGASWSDRQIQSAQMGLAPFLQRLEFEGVRRKRVDAEAEPKYSPVFEARGATIAVKAHKETDGVWFRLEITPRAGVAPADQSKVSPGDPFVPDYAQLASHTQAWEFRMPGWKVDALDRTAAADSTPPRVPTLPPGATEPPNK